MAQLDHEVLGKLNADAAQENELKCVIKNVAQFKTCLESVKFPTTVKNKFMVSIYYRNSNIYISFASGRDLASAQEWNRAQIGSHFREYNDAVLDQKRFLRRQLLPDRT